MSPNEASIDIARLSDKERMTLWRALPKTDLHCHLDGSLRAETVAELAADSRIRDRATRLGYSLPEDTSVVNMRRLLSPGLACQSLEQYLVGFDVTCGVLQSAETLERAAYELARDAAAENVWYLEVRFAPQRHVNDGLDMLAILRAVDAGLARAERDEGGRIRTAIIVCALRFFHESIGWYYRKVQDVFRSSRAKELASHCSLEVARVAVKARQQGVTRVVGFDLAGPENGYPPSEHVEAFNEIINNLMSITVHAGEGYGPASIKQAVTHLNCHRIGHGTRLLEDPDPSLLEFIRDHRIAVEVCLTSNLQTKAVQSLDQHPFKKLIDHEVRATLCTDNRLVSAITLSDEYETAYRQWKLTPKEIRRMVLYGFKSAFVPYAERRQLLLASKARLRELGLGGQWSHAEEEALAAFTAGRA